MVAYSRSLFYSLSSKCSYTLRYRVRYQTLLDTVKVHTVGLPNYGINVERLDEYVGTQLLAQTSDSCILGRILSFNFANL